MQEDKPTNQQPLSPKRSTLVRIVGVLVMVGIVGVAAIVIQQNTKTQEPPSPTPSVPDAWPTDVPFPTEFEPAAIDEYLSEDYSIVTDIEFTEENQEQISFWITLADGSRSLIGPVPTTTTMHYITEEGTYSVMEYDYPVKQFLASPPFLYSVAPDGAGVYFVMDLQGQEYRIFLETTE